MNATRSLSSGGHAGPGERRTSPKKRTCVRSARCSRRDRQSSSYPLPVAPRRPRCAGPLIQDGSLITAIHKIASTAVSNRFTAVQRTPYECGKLGPSYPHFLWTSLWTNVPIGASDAAFHEAPEFRAVIVELPQARVGGDVPSFVVRISA